MGSTYFALVMQVGSYLVVCCILDKTTQEKDDYFNNHIIIIISIGFGGGSRIRAYDHLL